MTRETAHQLLEEASEMNPGAWIPHSKNVALAAERIAAQCGLDPVKAYTLGLMHDIGRRFGVHKVRHGLDGYRFLIDLEYPDQAQISLSHCYTVQDPDLWEHHDDYTPEEREEVRRILPEMTYTDYDTLIQLCDSLALPHGMCSVETRICDVWQRHQNRSRELMNNDLSRIKLRTYFEKKYGCDVYDAITCSDLRQMVFLG